MNPSDSPLMPDLPPDDGGGDGGGGPLPTIVTITQISPIGGALAGGADVTLRGSGFQTGAEVFFGSAASPQVIFISSLQVVAKSPPGNQVGTVAVSLVNPDGGSATAPAGFTYVTSESSLHAEVLGVSPLAVIEDTETEITIRGRNLISAYNDGIVALRGSSRVHVTFSSFGSSTDPHTGIDSLILTVRTTATPPLQQHERMAIQVLASLRSGASSDGVFESSKQMFAVLPRAVPVALAFTSGIEAGKPNLVIVAGRNLDGAQLDLGAQATVHLQRSDDRTIAALVSFPEGSSTPGSVPLTVLDSGGQEFAQLSLSVEQPLQLQANLAGGSAEASAPADAIPRLTLSPVPGQQVTACTGP